MRKKISLIILSSLIIIIGLSSFNDDKNFEIAKNLDIYYTLFKELNNYYVDDIDAGEMIKTSIDEMLVTLDPYTTYIPESKIEDYKFMTTGQYGGVGAMIRQEKDYVCISEVYEGFPAHKAGLKAGDLVYEIEGKSAQGMNTEQISMMLKGQPGTEFSIRIKRPNYPDLLEKKIVREKITISSVPYATVLDDSVGYIVLTSFTQYCSQEVKKAFAELKKQGIKSLIFDLRNNPGGLLIESVNIANIFIGQGQEIVNTRGKYSKFDAKYSTNYPAVDDSIPIAVLINRGSASASEIVSGSLQDLDRAVIIGQKSYGKGLVQTTRELSYNSKLKVTTAKYYIPSGRCIQALDYSHRNEDGSVGKVPDSLISAYQTKNGRTVYDGGGIDPDIKTDEIELSILAYELMAENYIFNFATSYAQKHDSIADPKTFDVDDKLFDEFKTFVRSSDFHYQLDSEKDLDALINTAKKETYYGSIENEINALQDALKKSKKGDLDKHKDELETIIASEIISRYYFQKGQIIHQLKDDPEVEKAISILKKTEEYYNILAKE